MDKGQLVRIVEALVFASETPLSVNQMHAILKDVEPSEIEAALTQLAAELQERAIYLKRVGGGYRFSTRADYADWISEMFQEKAKSRMSRAALESLAIVAFKQPISRVEVSAIRGVNSDGVMKKLLDFRLITISGRDSGPGRPLLFKTTQEFLNYFGINDISELPRPKEIEELLAEGEGAEILKEIPNEAVAAEAATAADGETPEDENSPPASEPAAESESDLSYDADQ
ncbi:SMC-Scp complex subunit ScpB [candidate division KSB1 bacterium]|nr:SMC-Scp complex subunit ScpB [candidate division KSB1 bacterium]